MSLVTCTATSSLINATTNDSKGNAVTTSAVGATKARGRQPATVAREVERSWTRRSSPSTSLALPPGRRELPRKVNG
eukprot:3728777-Heterocapsa_arctica.AAC.1